jgi:hypothetical protein
MEGTEDSESVSRGPYIFCCMPRAVEDVHEDESSVFSQKSFK